MPEGGRAVVGIYGRRYLRRTLRETSALVATSSFVGKIGDSYDSSWNSRANEIATRVILIGREDQRKKNIYHVNTWDHTYFAPLPRLSARYAGCDKNGEKNTLPNVEYFQIPRERVRRRAASLFTAVTSLQLPNKKVNQENVFLYNLSKKKLQPRIIIPHVGASGNVGFPDVLLIQNSWHSRVTSLALSIFSYRFVPHVPFQISRQSYLSRKTSRSFFPSLLCVFEALSRIFRLCPHTVLVRTSISLQVIATH